jgi:uncharacterized protein (TIGR02145 family)
MKKLLFCVCVFCSINLNAQNYYITFGGAGAAASVSTVKVENLTAGTSLLLNGTDILHLTSVTTGVNKIANEQVSKLKIYPNPMSDFSALLVSPAESGNASISIIDMSGKTVAGINSYLEKSDNEFRLSGLKKGLYFVSVKGQNYLLSTKVLCNSDKIGSVRIEKVSSIKSSVEKKSETVSKELQSVVNMDYTDGERLKFTATSGKYSTVKTDIPTSDKALTFNFIECTDADGNNYPVVEIGTQVWMAENLKTTRYHGGTTIGTHSYGYYGGRDYIYPAGGNENNVLRFGRLYSWYAASDSACPVGWSLPAYRDWKKLTNGSDSSVTQDDSNNSYAKFPMAKSLAASTDWQTNAIEGSVGNKENDNNSTGFTGLPAGSSTGDIGAFGHWWILESVTIAEIEADNKNFIMHKIDSPTPGVLAYDLNQGKSVRCIKGYLLPKLTTAPVSHVTLSSAKSGASIISDGGTLVSSKGVCWSTSPNPTIANSHTNEGRGSDGFISSLSGLSGNTTYYVRAYVANSVGISYGDEVIFKTYTGIISDIDGNKYYTVTIGDQEWMAENLKTTRYHGGTTIGTHTFGYYGGRDYIWPAGGNENNVLRFGRLYSWYASKDSACPVGWRLPSYSDWKKLTNGSDSTVTHDDSYSSSTNFPVAKSLAASTDWQTNVIDGSVGNKEKNNNSTGFTGLPAGSNVGDIGAFGHWWVLEAVTMAEIEADSKNFIMHRLDPNTPGLLASYLNEGKSVRCIKGYLLPKLTTASVSYVTLATAKSGASINGDGGTVITSKGVCWSTSPNPTIANSHTNEGPGSDGFTSSLTGLSGNTTYYVRAYATNSVGTSYGDAVIFKTYTGILSDIDGNNYYTVTIGDQVWMAENLKSTKYNDNTLVPLVAGATQWSSLTTPGYCWYENDETGNGDKYGALYNWYTVSAANNGGKNVCPTGWHVPGDAEWTVLTTYLGGESIAGDKLKESDSFHWYSSNSGTNSSGFTALPGGDRSEEGVFSDIGSDGTFWSSSSANTDNAWFRSMSYNQSNVHRDTYLKKDGFSIRCLKD